jgi:CspA family cold shock protein
MENEEGKVSVIGTVKWFDDEKGFGFLEYNHCDYFLHYRQLQGTGFKSVRPGQDVSFEIESSEKGPYAANVRKLEPNGV